MQNLLDLMAALNLTTMRKEIIFMLIAWLLLAINSELQAQSMNVPVLIRPLHKQVIKEIQSRHLIFSWQPAIGTLSTTQYLFKIVEVESSDYEPGDIMESATAPLMEKIVSGTTLVYTPDLPALMSGKTYAWQITAMGTQGQKPSMYSAVRSEVYTFTMDTNAASYYYCSCSVSNVSIQRIQKSPNFFTYQGTVQGACSGEYYCQGTNRIEYQWTVVSGAANIEGPDNGPTVNIATAGPTTFTIALQGTIVCSDSTTCSSTNTYTDTFAYEPKNCDCNVDVDCKKVQSQGNMRTFEGVLNGGCTGEFGLTAPYQPCTIKNITWFWQVIEGNDVAEINGAADQQTVNVLIKGTGPYQMRVQADVECSDGTKTCSSFDYCFDTASVEKKCGFVYQESNQPAMVGGLYKVMRYGDLAMFSKEQNVSGNNKIRRDDFIALVAKGEDFDKVTIECTPSYECDEARKKSTKDVLLAGKVRFEWEIQSGEGNFVKLGGLPENITSDVGDRVIFQPPYVPLPENGHKNTKTTVIFLRLIDETGAGLLLDENVYDRVTITTTRLKNFDQDYYTIEVQNTSQTYFSKPDLQVDNNGVCKADYGWDKPNDLRMPTIQLPQVPDNNKIVLGQWMILEANNQNETDELKMVCDATDCEDDGGKKDYPDNIEWTWTIQNNDGTKGRFIGGNTGRYVIYEAPDKMPLPRITELTVDIVVSVKNRNVQKNDITFTSRPVTFKIFKPGVQLEYPPLDWLPENGNSVTLKSSLLYFENGNWKPGLAHMSRIHFFELLYVSREKGTCLNEPTPRNAKQCRDLLLKKEGHTEVFERHKDPGPFNCDHKKYYLHARSQKPKKEETVKVYCEDFGAYGFLRSFANINQGGRDSIKGESPVYEPVPVPANLVAHPSGRPKKTIYSDNRVTVPRDVDENRIADNGWNTVGGIKINDPQHPKEDNDNQLPGDGYNGDGLSNYEEYRGFFISGDHLRTNINNKDLFIHNPNSLNLAMLQSALWNLNGERVYVHDIYEEEYVNNTRREINFNFNSDLHPVGSIAGFPGTAPVQKGLFLRSAITTTAGLNGNIESLNNLPAPPNWVRRVNIYRANVLAFSIRRGIRFPEKLSQVVAHEICHGINIYHHGQGVNNLHGLRSGDMRCIMRYDNRLPRIPGYIPERIGSILCNSDQGTGYNALVPCFPDLPVNRCFGSAAANRGFCIRKIRISCTEFPYPRY